MVTSSVNITCNGSYGCYQATFRMNTNDSVNILCAHALSSCAYANIGIFSINPSANVSIVAASGASLSYSVVSVSGVDTLKLDCLYADDANYIYPSCRGLLVHVVEASMVDVLCQGGVSSTMSTCQYADFILMAENVVIECSRNDSS